MIYYVIRSQDDDQLFWSNIEGWVDTGFETRFSETERHLLLLPFGGIWVYDFTN
jgi:hypothetical protein